MTSIMELAQSYEKDFKAGNPILSNKHIIHAFTEFVLQVAELSKYKGDTFTGEVLLDDVYTRNGMIWELLKTKAI